MLRVQTSGGTVSWYLADHLGTVRDLINNSGAIIDHVDFSAFGTVLGETSPTSGDRFMGFAMLQRDTVTGLNPAVHREENPGTGRWDSQDPLGLGAGDDDVYRYLTNAPTNSIDPEGLFGIFPPCGTNPPRPANPVVPIIPSDGSSPTAFYNWLAWMWNNDFYWDWDWPFASPFPKGPLKVPPKLPPYRVNPRQPSFVIPPYSLVDYYTGWELFPWIDKNGDAGGYYSVVSFWDKV